MNMNTINARGIQKSFVKTKIEWLARLRRKTDDEILRQNKDIAFYSANYGKTYADALKQLKLEIEINRPEKATPKPKVTKLSEPELGHWEFVNTGRGGQERFWVTAPRLN